MGMVWYIAPDPNEALGDSSRALCTHFRFRCVFRAVKAASAFLRRPFACVELKTATEVGWAWLWAFSRSKLVSGLQSLRTAHHQWQWPRPQIPDFRAIVVAASQPPRNAKFHFLLRLALGKCKSLGFLSASVYLSQLLWPDPMFALHQIGSRLR